MSINSTQRAWDLIWSRLSKFALQNENVIPNPLGAKASSIDETVILKVDAATGDDANYGLTTDTFKSIQAAIDFISGFEINAPVYINVAGGAYNGFRIDGLKFGRTGQPDAGFVAIVGEVGLATLSSGPNTGIVTAATNNLGIALSSFTVGGANWTTDALKGKFIFVNTKNNSKYVPIISNTADTITHYSFTDTVAVNDTVSIVEPLVVIDATNTANMALNARTLGLTTSSPTVFTGTEGNAVIRITNCRGADHSTIGEAPRILLSNLQVSTSVAGTACIRVSESDVVIRVLSTGGTGSGAHILNTGGNVTVIGWYSSGTGTSFHGLQSASVYNKGAVVITNAFIDKVGGNGISGCYRLGTNDVYIKGCQTGIAGQDGNYSLLRTGFESCVFGFQNEQGAAYNTLRPCVMTLDGAVFTNCTTAVALKGLHWMQSKYVGGAGNTNAVVADQGARVGIRGDFNPAAVNEITIDGVVSTYATMRNAVPPVTNNQTYFTVVYSSDY